MDTPDSKQSNSAQRTQIVVALIAVAGVIFTAVVTLIGNKSDSSKPAINNINNNNNSIVNNLGRTQEIKDEDAIDDSINSCIIGDMGQRKKPSKHQMTTSLVFMAFSDRRDCVEVLLRAGADINGVGGDANYRGPALHIAITQKNWDLANDLLNQGANPNLNYNTYSGPKTALQMSGLYDAPAYFIEELKQKRAK